MESKLEKFNINADPHTLGEAWKKWKRRLQVFLGSQRITNSEQKRDILLHYGGPDLLDLYDSLPEEGEEEGGDNSVFGKAVRTLDKYFNPKVDVEFAVYTFRSSRQEQNESLDRYVARLRGLSQSCGFTDVNTEIRHQVIAGCIDNDLRSHILLKKPTLEEIMTYARSQNMASFQAISIGHATMASSTTGSTVNTGSTVQPLGPGEVNKITYNNKPTASASQTTHNKPCWRCGGRRHQPHRCPFKEEQCYKCNAKGHTKSRCAAVAAFRANYANRQQTNQLEQTQDQESIADTVAASSEFLGHLNTVQDHHMMHKVPPFTMALLVDSSQIQFEIDTGSPCTIVNRSTFQKLCKPLGKTRVSLTTYSKTPVNIIGEVQVVVNSKSLRLVVVEDGVCLLGRDWITALSLSVDNLLANNQVHAMLDKPQKTLQAVLDSHKPLFEDTLGKLNTVTVSFIPKENPPQANLFFKYASPTYAEREKCDSKLDQMLDEGIIEPVRHSDIACPLVIADKANGDIRLCGAYNLTANKLLETEVYPLPVLDDIVQTLQGGIKFTKIDLSRAYNQLVIDESSRVYTTINTHRGLFQYTRLPYGIASAPALFQRQMDIILAGIPMCCAYIDDIIVSGRNDHEHLKNLCEVLDRLQESGLKIQEQKCSFWQDSVIYLGHILSAEGLKPTEDKLAAIRNAPVPKNQEELSSYLDLLEYSSSLRVAWKTVEMHSY